MDHAMIIMKLDCASPFTAQTQRFLTHPSQLEASRKNRGG